MKTTNSFKRLLVYLRKQRWCFICTKWVPILFTIGLTIHCWLLFTGYRYAIVEYMFVCPPVGWLLFLYLSHKMGFCWVHKAMVAYVGIVSVMHIMNRYDAFGDDVQFWRFTMGSVGIFLLLSLYFKLYVRKEKIARSLKKCGRSRRDQSMQLE